jgi:transposase
MGRGDLTDAEWERLAPLLPPTGGRGGRWADHRTVINGICHRVRTGVPWRDLPTEFGEWITVYKRFRRWSADGTWDRLLQVVRAEADAVGDIGWQVSVDSTIERAHQHAAGAPHRPPPPPVPPPAVKRGSRAGTNQDKQAWRELAVLLEEVARQAKR